MGTTTLPEYGILPVTETRRFGPTRNPWDPERTPGGSSGGSAAAVASGMVPIAHANDGGGSIRIPAACCGLVGLKPQRGRVSLAPDVGGSFLVADGVVSGTVRETAALLDVLAGPELGDAYWAPEPAEPFAAAAERAPSGLRIAMTTAAPLDDAELDPVCAQAVHDAADLLRGARARGRRGRRRRGPRPGCSSSSRPPSARRSARRSPSGRCSPAGSPRPTTWSR